MRDGTLSVIVSSPKIYENFQIYFILVKGHSLEDKICIIRYLFGEEKCLAYVLKAQL